MAWFHVRLALRTLRRAPGFLVAAVVSLALGVGLNGAIFAFLDAALLRPPPYHDPARLVTVQDSRTVPDHYLLTAAEYERLRRHATVFEQVGAYRAGGSYRHALQFEDARGKATGFAVSVSTFGTLAVAPLLGRPLQADDERADAPPVVVIGGNLWRRAFGGLPSAIGAEMRIDGRLHTVVGVMPAAFWFPEWRGEFWVPLVARGQTAGGADRELSVVGRVRAGTPPARVSAELETIGRQLDAADAEGRPRAAGRQTARWWRVVPYADVVRPGDIHLFFILQGIAAAVLLLACINVSNLMLVRMSHRRAELGVRTALGATRLQRLLPFLTEAAVIAALTAIAAGALAYAATRLTAAAFERPMVADLLARSGTHVVAFAAVGAMLALLLCTIGPVIQAVRLDLQPLRPEAGRVVGGGRGARLGRRTAVGVQLALSLALCSCAAFLVGALQRRAAWAPAFPVDGLWTMPLRTADPPGAASAPEGAVAPRTATPRLLERLRLEPGVRSVAAVRAFTPRDGRLVSDGGAEAAWCTCQEVTLDYARTMGLRVRHGRAFLRDDLGAGPAALVDERLARTLWPGLDAVGRRVRLGTDGRLAEVVGVVGAVDFVRPAADRTIPAQPGLFLLVPDDTIGRGTLLLRVEPTASLAAARRAIAEVDPEQRVQSLVPFRQVLEKNWRPLRLYGGVFGALAVLALVLAIVGLNGVLAYHVATFRQEYAVRAALGASPRTLRRAVAWDAGRIGLLAGPVGAALALVACRLLDAAIVGGDGGGTIGALVLAGVTITVAGALATVRPARRAATVDPASDLRV